MQPGALSEMADSLGKCVLVLRSDTAMNVLELISETGNSVIARFVTGLSRIVSDTMKVRTTGRADAIRVGVCTITYILVDVWVKCVGAVFTTSADTCKRACSCHSGKRACSDECGYSFHLSLLV